MHNPDSKYRSLCSQPRAMEIRALVVRQKTLGLFLIQPESSSRQLSQGLRGKDHCALESLILGPIYFPFSFCLRQVSCTQSWSHICCEAEGDFQLLILLPLASEVYDSSVHHHAPLMWCWGLNSGLCACQAGTLPTEPHLQPLMFSLKADEAACNGDQTSYSI